MIRDNRTTYGRSISVVGVGPEGGYNVLAHRPSFASSQSSSMIWIDRGRPWMAPVVIEGRSMKRIANERFMMM